VGVCHRKAHRLSELTSQRTGRHWIFFDCETSYRKINDTDTRHELKLGIAHYYNLRRKRPHPLECIFHTHEELYEFVVSKTHSKETLSIAALNVAFDFATGGLGKTLPEHGWELKSFVFNGGLVILKFRRGTRKIMIYDVLNWVRASAKQMGKLLGLPKMEVDFESVNDADLIDYCRRDVEIISSMMLNYFEFVQVNDLGSVGPTISSQALIAFRHRFMRHDIYIHNIQSVINLERESYYGGRTECFKLGKVLGPIYYLDINSMYPYVMHSAKYPIYLVGSRVGRIPENLVRDHIHSHSLVARIDCEISDPCIPLRQGGKTIFPTGKLRVTVGNKGLEYILDNGQINKVHAVAFYAQAAIFRDYIEYFHQLKNKYGQEDNPVYRNIAKGLMNHLYGKFGQKGHDNIELGDTDNPDFNEVTCINLETGKKWVEFSILGKKYRRDIMEKEAYNSFPAIAAAVTENARFELWRLICQAGRENVYYCDTDSVFVNQSGYEALQDEIDDDKLGKLKLEAIYDWVIFRGLKDYETPKYTRRKGVKRNAKQLSDTTFRQTHFPTFRGVLRANMRDHIITKDVEKTLSREYNKGIVTQTGQIEPYYLSQW